MTKNLIIRMIRSMLRYRLNPPEPKEEREFPCTFEWALDICFTCFACIYDIASPTNTVTPGPLEMNDQSREVFPTMDTFIANPEEDYFCPKSHFEKLECILEHLIAESNCK